MRTGRRGGWTRRRGRVVVPWTTGALVALSAACGGERAGTGWLGSVDTLASGAVRVQSPMGSVWDDGGAWRLIEEVRIGAMDMPEAELFGGVNGLLHDDHMRTYVLDRGARRIQLFDARGDFVRSIGREGQGPGELADPIGMTWAAPGRILVADPNNGRYSIFDTSGVFVESHRRTLGGYSVPWRARVDGRGRLGELAFTGGGHALVTTDTAFAAVDTLFLPPFEGEEFELTTERMQMTAPVPFASSQVRALDPREGVWVATTGEYRLVKLGEGGDTVRIVEKDARRLPVTAAERETAVERLEWFVRQGGKIDPSRIPDEKPYFSDLFVSEDGHLWVLRSSAAEADSTRLDVFDPEGRYLGPVRLPGPVSSRSLFETDHTLVVTADSLGVPYVVRYRIERRGADPG